VITLFLNGWIDAGIIKNPRVLSLGGFSKSEAVLVK